MQAIMTRSIDIIDTLLDNPKTDLKLEDKMVLYLYLIAHSGWWDI